MFSNEIFVGHGKIQVVSVLSTAVTTYILLCEYLSVVTGHLTADYFRKKNIVQRILLYLNLSITIPSQSLEQN